MFLEDFVNKSHNNLLSVNSKLALAYLVSRGLNLEDIKKYKIGLSPTSIVNLDNLELEGAESFNRWTGHRGKFVKNRLVFPIYDELGLIRGIETRALDKRSMGVLREDFKKKLNNIIDNLPENEIRYKKFYFEKSKHMPTFFGLPQSLKSIWESEEVFLTEGIFDMLTLSKIKPNCLSTLTANINAHQIDWLKRYVKKIIVIFDMDAKGKQSAEKIKSIFKGEIDVYTIPIKGKDINDYVMNNSLKDLNYYLNDKLDSIF